MNDVAKLKQLVNKRPLGGLFPEETFKVTIPLEGDVGFGKGLFHVENRKGNLKGSFPITTKIIKILAGRKSAYFRGRANEAGIAFSVEDKTCRPW
jgi:hypothetical protein